MTALLWFAGGMIAGAFGFYLCAVGAAWWQDRVELRGDWWDR
jgi:hypothetical protein